MQRARSRVKQMAADEARESEETTVAANAAALERARSRRMTAEEAVRQLEEETLGDCGAAADVGGNSSDGAGLSNTEPRDAKSRAVRRTAAPIDDLLDLPLDVDATSATSAQASSRVTRAKETNLARRVSKRLLRARSTNVEVRSRAADDRNIGEAAMYMIEQWRPAGLPAPNTPTTPRSTAAAAACALHRLSVLVRQIAFGDRAPRRAPPAQSPGRNHLLMRSALFPRPRRSPQSWAQGLVWSCRSMSTQSSTT